MATFLQNKLQHIATLLYLCTVFERKIITYKNYFLDFMSTLDEGAERKVYYSLDMLKTQRRISEKFVKHIRAGVYELRAEYEGNYIPCFLLF